MKQETHLRDLIAAPQIVIVPGVYDTFSAFRAQQAGFRAVFVSGSALATMHLARPDVGLLSLTETAEIVGRIADRVDAHLFVDADQGFGNALAVSRAVRLLERAGASAIQIEDQQEIKPAEAPLSRPLVEPAVMVDKIKAALDSRRNASTVISARSDAMFTEGFDRALERAHLYADAGADLIFVESLSKIADMEKLVAAIGPKAPLLHNLLRVTDEVRDAATVERMGYGVALFPGAVTTAVGEALDAALSTLHTSPRLADAVAVVDRVDAAQFLGTAQ